jgi:hypothetical protein
MSSHARRQTHVNVGIFLAGLLVGGAVAGYFAASAASSASKSRCEQENSLFLKDLSSLVEKVREWVREGKRDKLRSFLEILNELREIYFLGRDYIDAFVGLTQPPPVNATRADLLAYTDFQSRNINTIFGQACEFKDLVRDLLVRSGVLVHDP